MAYKNKKKRNENARKWRLANQGKVRASMKKWRTANAEKIKKYKLERHLANPNERYEQHQKWCQKNRKRIAIYIKQKLKNDINFRLAHGLRSRLHEALRGNKKIFSTLVLLGCSLKELRKHLESQWQIGMTWNNWSKNGWHIDHKIPLSVFDLTDQKQLEKVCHYTNLQPLWAKENIKKGGVRKLFIVRENTSTFSIPQREAGLPAFDKIGLPINYHEQQYKSSNY